LTENLGDLLLAFYRDLTPFNFNSFCNFRPLIFSPALSSWQKSFTSAASDLKKAVSIDGEGKTMKLNHVKYEMSLLIYTSYSSVKSCKI